MRKENPLPQFKVASYKRLGIRLSFEDPTTPLPGGGGRGREESVGYELGKMPPKYAIFSTVLSKIVANFSSLGSAEWHDTTKSITSQGKLAWQSRPAQGPHSNREEK